MNAETPAQAQAEEPVKPREEVKADDGRQPRTPIEGLCYRHPEMADSAAELGSEASEDTMNDIESISESGGAGEDEESKEASDGDPHNSQPKHMASAHTSTRARLRSTPNAYERAPDRDH